MGSSKRPLASRFGPSPRDPLAIDFDGDGIETMGVGGANGTVLFDHDADGVRTGTGWLLLSVAAWVDVWRPRVMAVVGALAAYLAVPVLLGAEVLFTVLLAWAATMLLAVLADRAPQAGGGAV